jgi:hypothetical protein
VSDDLEVNAATAADPAIPLTNCRRVDRRRGRVKVHYADFDWTVNGARQ